MALARSIRRERNAPLPAPGARVGNALLDGGGELGGCDVDEVVQRHLGSQHLDLDRPAEFAALALGNRLVAGFDAVEIALQVPVGGRLDDLEVGIDEAALPALLAADGPDDPELLGTAADRFHQVGIGQIDAIDVAVAIDRHRCEPHRQRHASDEQVLAHPLVLDHLELVPGEVVDVEGAEALCGLDLVPVELPALAQHQLAEFVVGDQRLRPVEAHELEPVEPDRTEDRKTAPVVGHLLASHALAIHGEIEDASRCAVGMVEGQTRLVEPHLQHARLIGDLHSAPGEYKRPLWHCCLPSHPLANTTPSGSTWHAPFCA